MPLLFAAMLQPILANLNDWNDAAASVWIIDSAEAVDNIQRIDHAMQFCSALGFDSVTALAIASSSPCDARANLRAHLRQALFLQHQVLLI